MPLIDLFPALVAAVLSWMVPHPSVAPQQVTACDIEAYVIDSDPRGLNVRASPAIASRVLARIRTDAYVTVTGSSGRWLRVTEAVETSTDCDDTVTFRGTGWVFANRLGTGSASTGPSPLRAEPRAGSRVLRRLGEDMQVTLVSCSGDWAQVDAGGTVGWLAPESRCNNQQTTCS